MVNFKLGRYEQLIINSKCPIDNYSSDKLCALEKKMIQVN